MCLLIDGFGSVRPNSFVRRNINSTSDAVPNDIAMAPVTAPSNPVNMSKYIAIARTNVAPNIVPAQTIAGLQNFRAIPYKYILIIKRQGKGNNQVKDCEA